MLENEFPPDERVEKEIDTLKEMGNEIHLACYTRESRQAREERDGLIIHRMRLTRLLYKLSALILIIPIYKNRWYRFVHKLYRSFNYDVIHIHDLPLSMVGLKLKSKYGLQVVCDQHELYSNWIIDTAHYNTLAGKIIKSLSNWEKFENKALHLADAILTVEEPLKNTYLERYNLPEKKIFVLPNTPSKRLFNYSRVDATEFPHYRDQFVLLYLGGIDILRGIDFIIQSIPLIVNRIPEFKFVLAGTIKKGYDPFKTSNKLGVKKYVDYLGCLNRARLPSLISVSDLGVFTPRSDRDEINRTIATKNYQFLVMNKPIIVGSAKYMKEFTEKNQIGMSVNEYDPEDISEKISAYYSDLKLREGLINNCKKISSKYFWEYSSASLKDCYKLLLS
ncbi:MAG: glycosyltransferase [Bacteroidota bacterium]